MRAGVTDMELLFNELSIHGQFPDLATFRAAVSRVMAIRALLRRFGRDLYCHRNVVNRQATRDATIPQAIHALDRESRGALMAWLTRRGPFWEDGREHSGEDYLDCVQWEERIVTDTAVGEAAYGRLHGRDRGLVSMTPSSWRFSPVSVNWHEGGNVSSIDVRNYWGADALEAELGDLTPPLGSWPDLESAARSSCPGLVFALDSFGPLLGHPFHLGVAERLLMRLIVLNKLRDAFDERGERTPEGHRLYQEHFTGDKAWFSDSSATEKRDFRAELTFPNPSRPGESLFCTWHGKVKTPQLRFHFSWPIRATEPLYVVYVGPKITK